MRGRDCAYPLLVPSDSESYAYLDPARAQLFDHLLMTSPGTAQEAVTRSAGLGVAVHVPVKHRGSGDILCVPPQAVEG